MKNLSTSQILFAIARCYARLSGELDMGLMDNELTLKALEEYKYELRKRGFVI